MATDDREGFHDVVYIIPTDAIEMEESGVELTPQVKAAFRIPRKGRSFAAKILGEELQVMGCVNELKDTREDPITE